MYMGKNKTYPKESEEKLNETIKKLRSRLRKAQKDLKQLREEYATLERAWEQSEKFLREKLKDVPLENVLKYNKLPRKIVKKAQPTVDKRQQVIEDMQVFSQSLKENKHEPEDE